MTDATADGSPTTRPETDSPMTTHRPLVVLDKVNKHFGDLHVLKDIDLTIGEGEVVVVIGPSGSGKSTLCRTINRLETLESGQGAGPAPGRRRHGLSELQPLRAQDDS
jgi:glutamate transport system ATP-binding protein